VERLAPGRESVSDGRRLRGKGIAAVSWLTNPMPASVVLKLDDDGCVVLPRPAARAAPAR
jgi:hypothetical protein